MFKSLKLSLKYDKPIKIYMINKMNTLLILKLFVFFYIVTSPLINHKKYIPFMNTLPAKITIVILIILAGFYDIQLSILLAIALFVMIINFNNNLISSVKPPSAIIKTQQEQKVAKKIVEIEDPESSNYTTTYAHPDLKNKEDKPDVVPYIGETIHEFPTSACGAPFEDTTMSKDLLTYFIDEKTKPYETYIRQLTNGNYLIDAQTNTFQKL